MADTDPTDERPTEPRGEASPAFLLAQVGAHAAARFAERLREIDLAPAHAGILRVLAATPGITQQELATRLGTPPSRLVALMDELEAKELIGRESHETDRRRYALRLTTKGRAALKSVGRAAREHQTALLAALSEDERSLLAGLLLRVADEQGLSRGVHPGFAGAPAKGPAGRA